MLDIKILGPGCANCIKLENMSREVLAENNLMISTGTQKNY
jgi:hypothetical protein